MAVGAAQRVGRRGRVCKRGCVREVYEEAGLRARASKLLALYDRDKHPHPPLPFHIYKLFFLCEALGEGPVARGVKTDAAGFFRQEELPRLLVMRVTPWQMGRLFEHHRNPDWPADFD